MYKLGLKLWSLNTDYYYQEAQKLYKQSFFDYIELYIVPHTLHTLPMWKKLDELISDYLGSVSLAVLVRK